MQHHLDVFDEVSQDDIEFESESKELSEEQNQSRKLLNMSVNEIELSVRAANCLNRQHHHRRRTGNEVGAKCSSIVTLVKSRSMRSKTSSSSLVSLGMKIDERLLEKGSEF